jgi:Beta protein
MPILKTKKGEWEALRHLAESDRDLIFPLIECTTLVFAPQQAAVDHLKKHVDALGRSLELAGAITHLTAGTVPPKRPRLGFPGRKRDRQKERERLYDLAPPTSREDDDEGGED